MKQQDLTEGNITKNLLLFAFPMMLGNLLQQCYNIADTFIVGRFLGSNALAGVGASYSFMTFLTSMILGLCMGSGAVFSIRFGEKNQKRLKLCIVHSFCMIALVTIFLNIVVFLGLDISLKWLQVPVEVVPNMKKYLQVIFLGIIATFLYNYFTALLRSLGNSIVPLIFLGVSAVLNIGLDLFFVLGMKWGVAGAGLATVLSQWISGIGIAMYTITHLKEIRITREELHFDKNVLREIVGLSFLTCVQQSIMNLGILMVQGIVNSFGTAVMAAFAAAVKIDSFAYMPVQDFGNAFSTFIAQNFGAGKKERIKKGIKSAFCTSFLFCIVISTIVFLLARQLMQIFIDPSEVETIAVGVQYLRIEGIFYFGIGILFLLYGYYRAVKKPVMSIILTVLSLGTRVLLAYVLSANPSIGVVGIWVSVPIGWILADMVGILYYWKVEEL